MDCKLARRIIRRCLAAGKAFSSAQEYNAAVHLSECHHPTCANVSLAYYTRVLVRKLCAACFAPTLRGHARPT